MEATPRPRFGLMLFSLLATLAFATIAHAAPTAPKTPSKPMAIKGAHLYPITSAPIVRGTVVWQDGRITAVGPENTVKVPKDATIIDGKGLHVLPGFIDTHSHMGVYSWPGVTANSDGNEATDPITAQVRAEDSINLEDPAWDRARAAGITAALILPGSANIIGGEGVVVKLRPGVLLDRMKMAEAPRQMKMAMGENPKRVYGDQGRFPSTRMGLMAKLREVFTVAQERRRKIEEFDRKKAKFDEKKAKWEALSAEEKAKEDEPEPPTPPDADPLSDALIDIMKGEVLVQVHCYRKDDVMDMLRIADEFGFKVTAFHHILEGYKVADELAARGISASTWPDWWGFKMEAMDATPYNAAIMAKAGVNVAMQSDSPLLVQFFPMEAAKLVKYGATEDQALAAITMNGAKMLGVAAHVGSLEPGKHADFAVMSDSPLNAMAENRMTFIDGVKVYDRKEAEAAEAERQRALEVKP